ncbi:MAG: DNA/RNA nuclease SfsA [Thermodesulfobacteriota bacterium]|nr:DNA/RNA nuclease SfsA [Thermodesulfobacteriota bacterium]
MRSRTGKSAGDMKPLGTHIQNPGRILKGRFLSRPNRFLVRCVADGQGEIDAHLPNPGRLWELLLPGAILYLQRTNDAIKARVAPRKTKYTALAVERDGCPVFLHTHATNRVAQYLIEEKLIPPLKKARIIQAEVPVGRSRFDFLLHEKGRDLYMEVKSCTLFGNKVAMFPDAVTERGKRHLLELAEMARKGIPTVVLFLVHSPRVKCFMPDYHTDFGFSTTMLKVREKVRIVPVAIGWKKDLTLQKGIKVLDVPWEYLKQEVKDRGSYLLLLRLEKKRTIMVGQLKKLQFSKGYYIYVGSAMGNLSARMARHRRKDKSRHWHIDYLTEKAEGVTPIPVRSSQRLECDMAKALSAIMESGPAGFGSSDCKCPTHLFWSPENPLHTETFHRMLQSFRMREP